MVAHLVALAEHLKSERERGAELGLSEDELAFDDAVCANASAVTVLGDDTLKKIAHDLFDIAGRDAKTDWNIKEQLRATIRRLLLRYGYPPDQEPTATQLVLEQAELSAGLQAA